MSEARARGGNELREAEIIQVVPAQVGWFACGREEPEGFVEYRHLSQEEGA